MQNITTLGKPFLGYKLRRGKKERKTHKKEWPSYCYVAPLVARTSLEPTLSWVEGRGSGHPHFSSSSKLFLRPLLPTICLKTQNKAIQLGMSM